MDEFYRAIEEKIAESGYPGPVDGETIYDEICDEIEDKENGTYLFLSRKPDGSVFEYKVDVLEENFNLSDVHITTGNSSYHIDFDN